MGGLVARATTTTPRIVSTYAAAAAPIKRGSGVDRQRLPARPVGLERADVGVVAQRDADVVEPLEQAPAGVVVDVEGVVDGVLALAGAHRARLEVDGDRSPRVGLEQVPQPLDDLLVDLGREQPGLAGVAAEDVG